MRKKSTNNGKCEQMQKRHKLGSENGSEEKNYDFKVKSTKEKNTRDNFCECIAVYNVRREA